MNKQDRAMKAMKEHDRYGWTGELILAVILLTVSLLLSGCVAVTPAGVTWTIRPIVDHRVPAPEVVAALEEIEAETGEPCIDLNVADVETLQLIVHIGPYRADYISDLRNLFEFSGADDLKIVPGIGDGRRLAQIKEQGLVCDDRVGAKAPKPYGKSQSGGGEYS